MSNTGLKNGSWVDAVYVRCVNCDARTNRVLYSKKLHPNDEEHSEAAEAFQLKI